MLSFLTFSNSASNVSIHLCKHVVFGHGKINVSKDLCKNVVDIWSCLVSGHLSEGLLELLGDCLVLLLLGNKLILQPVHLQQKKC